MFSIIVATNKSNGIGLLKSNKYSIPWFSSVDMKFFKDITTFSLPNKKNAIIMGRNTYFSLPERSNGNRFLEGRINIVITSKKELITEKNVYCFNSLEESFQYCNENQLIDKTFVIGGAKLYEEALKHPKLETVYWNVINDISETNISFPISKDFFDNYVLDINYDLANLENCDVKFNKYVKLTYNHDENNYLKLLKEIMDKGDIRQTRNSVTKSLFGKNLEFDLKNKFPLLTTKKMFLRGIFEELVWFLKGNTDSKLLEEKKVNIWKMNSSKEFIEGMNLPYREGDVGNMYGFQLKHSGAEYKGCDEDYTNQGFDQIEYCLNLLKKDKNSRRIIMSTFSPNTADKGVLYPCHGITIQWYVKEFDGINYLSCHMYQRSGDSFLGVPFNISSYALLTYMFCEVINNDSEYNDLPFKPDRLIMSFGDVHIYEDHYKHVLEQISRKPYIFPQITFKKKYTNLTDFNWEDISIDNYKSYEGIKAMMVA